MNKVVSRLIFCTLSLTIVGLVILGSSFLSVPIASAHGTASTLKNASQHVSRPATQPVDCNYAYASGIGYVELYTNSGPNYCYDGTGYIGIPVVQNVNTVWNWTSYKVWFVYYQNGNPGGHKVYMTSAGQSLGSAGITQICIKC